MKILTLGDIVGKPGRAALQDKLPAFRQEQGVDLCIANAENAAGGSGLTRDTADQVIAAGVDIITTGDHVWKKKDILKAIDRGLPIIRPENYPEGSPGRGFRLVKTASGCDVAVIQVLGRVFMNPIDCPFKAVDRALARISGRAQVFVVEVHAEATSEKIAMGYHLDGRASAVVGTHTHVQTADETVLKGGTAYITDLGMTGPVYSVLGRRVDRVLKRFVTGLPSPFDVAGGLTRILGAMIDVDPQTGRANSIERVSIDS